MLRTVSSLEVGLSTFNLEFLDQSVDCAGFIGSIHIRAPECIHSHYELDGSADRSVSKRSIESLHEKVALAEMEARRWSGLKLY